MAIYQLGENVVLANSSGRIARGTQRTSGMYIKDKKNRREGTLICPISDRVFGELNRGKRILGGEAQKEKVETW